MDQFESLHGMLFYLQPPTVAGSQTNGACIQLWKPSHIHTSTLDAWALKQKQFNPERV